MAGFRFELDVLLRYREHQRDQCRQLLAAVLEDQAGCEQQIAEIRAEREEISESFRQSHAVGKIDVAAMSSSRFYMSQLDGRKRQIDLQLVRIGQQLDLCRQAMRQADAAVKALEQLRDKRYRVYLQKELKQEQLQLQEAWSVTQGGFAQGN